METASNQPPPDAGPVVTCRRADIEDAAILARLNKELIVDEGHRNPMSPIELEERMRGFLADGYEAAIFERSGRTAGYALYRPEPDHVYLRQFYVCREERRSGVGRAAFAWLRSDAWASVPRFRLDVLVRNAAAIEFWRSVGFEAYCLTMEFNASH